MMTNLINRRNTIWTRGGSRGALAAKKANEVQKKKLELEEKWKKEENQPPIPHFTGISKINVDVLEDADVNFFVDLFITEELIDMIAGQTNLYAEQYRETNPNLSRNSRPGRWYNVKNREMKDFIALLLLTDVIQKPEINHYWSTDPLLKSSIFNETMVRNRYQAIMEFLHFNDNSNYNPNEPAIDKLYKIRPVMEYLVHRFQTMYTPEKNLSIDEELLLFKGRYVFN